MVIIIARGATTTMLVGVAERMIVGGARRMMVGGAKRMMIVGATVGAIAILGCERQGATFFSEVNVQIIF